MLYMDKIKEIGAQIEKAYAEDRYVDIDGNVWVVLEDERWYMEADEPHWLTNLQMMRKMSNELSGDEQFRRDEAVRIEALYEYSVRYTLQGKTLPVGHWMTKESAEEWLNQGGTSGQNAEFGTWTKTLVRRRKAGPVEEVNA